MQPGLGILKYNKKRSLAKNFEKEYKLSAVDLQPSTDTFTLFFLSFLSRLFRIYFTNLHSTFYLWKAVDRQPKAYILFQNF